MNRGTARTGDHAPAKTIFHRDPSPAFGVTDGKNRNASGSRSRIRGVPHVAHRHSAPPARRKPKALRTQKRASPPRVNAADRGFLAGIRRYARSNYISYKIYPIYCQHESVPLPDGRESAPTMARNGCSPFGKRAILPRPLFFLPPPPLWPGRYGDSNSKGSCAWTNLWKTGWEEEGYPLSFGRPHAGRWRKPFRHSGRKRRKKSEPEAAGLR